MAYRAKSKTRSRSRTRRNPAPARRRNRRMGAIGKRRESVSRLLGLVVGAVVPMFAANIKIKGEPINGKIVGAASVAIGYLLPSMVKGDIFAGVGDGMLASGGVMLLNEFNVLSGIPVIAGWQDMKTINGAPAAVAPEKSIRESGQNNVFRPSVSQMMNGFYNRRSLDGYAD